MDLLSNSLNQFFKEMYGDQFKKFASGYWGLIKGLIQVIVELYLWIARSTIRALNNITAVEGENWILTCGVTGNPAPSVSWTEVRTGSRTEGNIRELFNIRRNDAGEYKCEASSLCENDIKSTFLIVHCKWLLTYR